MKIKQFLTSPQAFWSIAFPLGVLWALASQLVATTCGLGLTYDGHLYLQGAEFFRGTVAGNLLEQDVFQAKPPLFSYLLSFVPSSIINYIYTGLLLLNLYLIARIIRQVFNSLRWQLIAYLAVASFAPIIMVHVYLWTEPLFLVLLYTTILVLLRAANSGLSSRSLGLLIILTTLMVLTRHVGIFFVLGILLAMVSATKNGWQRSLLVVAPAILVFLFWNFGLMAEGMSERLNTLQSPVSGGTWARLQNFQYYASAASTWILPNSLPQTLRIVVLIISGTLLFYFTNKELRTSTPVKLLLIISIVYYLLMHMSFLIDASSAERYLTPIYPLILISALHLLEKSTYARRQWLVYLVFVWLLYPVTRTVKNTIFWQEKICHEASANTVLNRLDNYQVKQE